MWYGSYGAPQLDEVLVHLPYWGDEFPEIVFTNPDRATVSHETAHQWFYGIVGDDQYSSPWLDESFASWNEEQMAPGAYVCNPKNPLDGHFRHLTLGLSYYESHPNEYTDVVYRGGARALTILAGWLGRSRFLSMLRTEVREHRYGVITTKQFLALLSKTDGPVARRWTELSGIPGVA